MDLITAKKRIIDRIIRAEGGYVNDVNDSGGATRWGITEAVARANGYKGPMNALPIDKARQIYERQYLSSIHFDQVYVVAPKVANKLADIAVNMGTHRAGVFFQHLLNALNNEGKHYADITEDGDIGPQTLQAFYAYSKKRGSTGLSVFANALKHLQGAFYIELTRRREKDEKFLYGWLLRVEEF